MNNKTFLRHAISYIVLSIGITLMSGQAFAYEELKHDWVGSETKVIGQGLAEYTKVSYAQGKRVGEKTFAADKKLDSEARYSYNNKNQITKQENLNKRGKLQGYVVFTYNAAGLLEKEEVFNKRGKLQAQEVYEHDSKGKLLGASVYEGKKKVATFKVTSYDKGRPQRVDLREEGDTKIAISIIYKYNKQGRLVSQSIFPKGETSGEAFVNVKYSY